MEWFIQDNWKVNNRLTLDYGVRLVHQQPQYDEYIQTSNFFPERWSPDAAPQLFQPGCANNVYPWSNAQRVALNPVTGQLLGRGSSVVIAVRDVARSVVRGAALVRAAAGLLLAAIAEQRRLRLGVPGPVPGSDPPSRSVPGATALSTDLLAPFRGIGGINAWTKSFYRTFHSIQMSAQRRFTRGFSGGFNYTWTLSDKGNEGVPLHSEHHADGSVGLRADRRSSRSSWRTWARESTR